MIKKIFTWLLSPLGRLSLLILGLILLSVVVWGIGLTQTSPEQPIQFPHDRHLGFGIQCLYCHPGASRGAASGLRPESCCGCG